MIVVAADQVHNVVSSELYEKYFYAWIFFKMNCFDEKHSKIYVYCSIKEVGFHVQAAALLMFLVFSVSSFFYKHYKYYLVLRNILDSQGNLDFKNVEIKPKTKKKL